MPELARVTTTDAEIDAAIRQARIYEKYDQHVVRATYSERTDRFLLRMENGVTHSIPRGLLQGLTDAQPGVLNEIELLGRGTGLYWPALDVAHSVAGLLAGVFGSERWMTALHDVEKPWIEHSQGGKKLIQLPSQIDENELRNGLKDVLEDTLAEAISQLPHQEGLVLAHHYINKMTTRDISLNTGLSESQIVDIYKSAMACILTPLKGIWPDTVQRVEAKRSSKQR